MSVPSSAPTLPVWWDAAADGPTNMALDELLAEEAARRGGPAVRLYSWAGTHVSLGGFQGLAEAEACAAIRGLPVVRRPSGGGAIVHGSDLTYAIAVPREHRWGAAPQALYDAAHAAMVEVLRGHGVDARLHPGRPETQPAPFLCFDRRATGDIVAAPSGRPRTDDDPKIMGSAQRRLGAVVLQHGSLLVRPNPDVGGAARHGGLRAVGGLGADVDPPGLATAWLLLLAAALGGEPTHQREPFASGREAELAPRADRFRDPRWTGRR